MRWADGEAERLNQIKEQSSPASVKIPNSIFVQYVSTDGRPYYYNTVTGTTQWEMPKELINPPKYLAHSQGPAGCNLFIFHLPIQWTENELISFFMPFGNVISARIMCDKTTGKSKGFGFVSYDNQVSALNAVKSMNGCNISGKRLKVQIKKGEGVPNYGNPFGQI